MPPGSGQLKSKINKEPRRERATILCKPKGLNRAYVFTGRTRKKRESKAMELVKADGFNMFGFLENEARTKSALYMTCEHYANIPTFEMVQAWAGKNECTSILDLAWRAWFNCKASMRFGVIDLEQRRRDKRAAIKA